VDQKELNMILDAHKKWLNNEDGGVRADLRRANLRRANLRRANLTDANLTDAKLKDANLTDANLDFSAWPLWCGSLSVKVDTRIRMQLAYHLLRVIGEDMEKFISDPIAFANWFHRVNECGEIKR